MTTIFILLYIFIYLIFFQIKSIRDYIMEYEKGYTHRWDNSIWKKAFPKWVSAYLLSDDETFFWEAPKWIVKLLYDKNTDNFKVGVDGWHQLDGIIFMMPHALVILLTGILIGLAWYWILLGMIVVPFIWYAYFNVNFHILHMKTKKQWFRVKWLAKLLGKNTER